MKAAVIREFGDVDVLKYEDIERPTPKPGHILIKVLAAGINRFDHYIRQGSVVPDLQFPHILGADAAGEVAELGQGVTGFEIGQPVIPVAGFPLDEDEYNIRPGGHGTELHASWVGHPGRLCPVHRDPRQVGGEG